MKGHPSRSISSTVQRECTYCSSVLFICRSLLPSRSLWRSENRRWHFFQWTVADLIGTLSSPSPSSKTVSPRGKTLQSSIYCWFCRPLKTQEDRSGWKGAGLSLADGQSHLSQKSLNRMVHAWYIRKLGFVHPFAFLISTTISVILPFRNVPITFINFVDCVALSRILAKIPTVRLSYQVKCW
jgi:hypothetical protein